MTQQFTMVIPIPLPLFSLKLVRRPYYEPYGYTCQNPYDCYHDHCYVHHVTPFLVPSHYIPSSFITQEAAITAISSREPTVMNTWHSA